MKQKKKNNATERDKTTNTIWVNDLAIWNVYKSLLLLYMVEFWSFKQLFI